jgi:hypothetical protein
VQQPKQHQQLLLLPDEVPGEEDILSLLGPLQPQHQPQAAPSAPAAPAAAGWEEEDFGEFAAAPAPVACAGAGAVQQPVQQLADPLVDLFGLPAPAVPGLLLALQQRQQQQQAFDPFLDLFELPLVAKAAPPAQPVPATAFAAKAPAVVPAPAVVGTAALLHGGVQRAQPQLLLAEEDEFGDFVKA